jgi:hypothetical protein
LDIHFFRLRGGKSDQRISARFRLHGFILVARINGVFLVSWSQ